MKRIAIFILIAVVLSCLCGCQSNVGDRFVYTGIDDDLYTETLHSILGVTGKDRNPEHGWIEPLIQVVDQDSYGRKMFLYYEGYTSNHFFLLVEQNKDADFVYYYSDYNFAIGECDNTLPQDLTTEQTGFMYFYLDYMWRARFTEEQISALKSNNDWNQEINKEKCIKQKKCVKRKIH